MKHLLFIIVFFSTITAYSQIEIVNNLVTGSIDTTRTIQNITLKNRVRVPENAIVANFGLNFPRLTNSVIYSDYWSKKVGIGIDFNVAYRRQFQKRTIENDAVVILPSMFAIGAGLGISSYNKTAGFEYFSETLENYLDSDGDRCDLFLNYSNVKESVSLTYLDIPVYFEIGKLSQVKPSVYGNIGFKASVLIVKKFRNLDGTYTSTAYYPEWDVTVYDIPQLGYFNNAPCYSAKPEQQACPFVLWGIISGGINIPFSSLDKNKVAKWVLRINADMNYSLSPISKKIEATSFDDAKYRLNQINMLSNGSRIFTAGFSVGVIYCL